MSTLAGRTILYPVPVPGGGEKTETFDLGDGEMALVEAMTGMGLSRDHFWAYLAETYPRIWAQGEDDEHSRNRNEEPFLNDLLTAASPVPSVLFATMAGIVTGLARGVELDNPMREPLQASATAPLPARA